MTAAAMTSTAAVWTSTPSPTPTATPTASATPTITSTPTDTPTPTLSPTPQGWIGPGNCGQITELKRIGDGKINQLIYSPDGRWLAAATSTGVSLYDLTTLTWVWTAPTQASLDQIAFSLESNLLVGVDPSTRIYTWQTSDGKQLLSRVPGGIQTPPNGLALSPDGTMLAVPYYDDSIHLYRTSDGGLENKIEQFLSIGEMIYQIAYSPDGKRLATISFNGELRLWDVDRNKLASVLRFDGTRRPYGMVFTPDGKDLAVNIETEDGEKTIRILDVYSARWQQSLQGELVVFSPDTSFISKASGGIDLRDYASGSVQNSIPEQGEIQGKPAFSPDGAYLAVGTQNGIHIWDREGPAQPVIIPGEYSNYSGLAVSADGLLFAGATSAGIEIRKLEDGSLIHEVSTGTEPRPFSAIAYSSRNNLVAGASGARVYVWNVEDENLLWSADIDYTVNDLTFSPDGALLAAAVSGEMLSLSESQKSIPVFVWDTADGFLVFDLTGSEQLFMTGFSSVAFSPDGNYLLAAEGNGDLDVWLVAETWKKISIPNEELLGWNQVIAFSPDSRQFVSGGMDRQIKLWKADTRKSIKTIKVGDDSITALAFSANGQMFASGISREIRLWRTNGGSIICSVKGSGGIIRRIVFTPDGRSMISLADDGVIRIWGAP